MPGARIPEDWETIFPIRRGFCDVLKLIAFLDGVSFLGCQWNVLSGDRFSFFVSGQMDGWIF